MAHSIEWIPKRKRDYSKEAATRTIAPIRLGGNEENLRKSQYEYLQYTKTSKLEGRNIRSLTQDCIYTACFFVEKNEYTSQRCFEKQSINKKNKKENIEKRGFLEMWNKQKWPKCSEYTFCQYNNIGLQVQTFISACMYQHHCTFEHKRQGRQNEQSLDKQYKWLALCALHSMAVTYNS